MATFQLTVSSPDGHLFQGDATALMVRGTEGDLAVLAGHIPFITAVVACDCRIQLPDGTERTGHTDGDLLTVNSDAVTLLSGSFRWE